MKNGHISIHGSFEVYQQEITDISRLSEDDERALIGEIIAAEDAKIQLKQNCRSRTLRNQIWRGEKARENLILSNLRMVIALAKKMVSKLTPTEIEDLVQAGNQGLIIASQRFNPLKAKSSGARFATYAFPWIKKFMIEEYKKAKYPIHVPDKRMRQVSSKHEIESGLTQLLGRQPTSDELAMTIASKNRIPINAAKTLLQKINAADIEVTSLYQNVGRDSKITLADSIIDPNRIERNIDDIIDDLSLSEDIRRPLNELTKRERDILEIRFGIGTGVGWTLEEVAKKWKLSKERIRQIEAKALRKMRHPSRSRKLKAYISAE
jgi:RNA polymerase primary sigma factor